MKSMLILTDFSETAFRAAEYACQLVDALQVNKVILYHAYQNVFVGTDLPSSTLAVERQVYMDSMEALGMLHDRLKPLLGNDVKIELLAKDTALFPDVINALCRQEDTGLIVMGASGKSGIEKMIMGSTTSQMLKTSEFPVLMVPHEALIGRGISRIVFSADLKDYSALPVNLLHQFLQAFPAELHIVNVMPEKREQYSPEMEESITKLHAALDKYNAAFHYIQGDDIVEHILSFAKQHHASLIIAVPRKHGLLDGIFHKSVSRQLAAHDDQVPLLALPAIS